MAGIILQPNKNGVWHSIVFWSQKFTEIETRYSTLDQELFAIVYFFKYWHQYLDRAQHTIKVLSDYTNLQAFIHQKKINRYQAHWYITLILYNFVIKHYTDKTNLIDALSRLFKGYRDIYNPDFLGSLQTRLREDLLVDYKLFIRQSAFLRWLAVTRDNIFVHP